MGLGGSTEKLRYLPSLSKNPEFGHFVISYGPQLVNFCQ
jgi:hypothetical protein